MKKALTTKEQLLFDFFASVYPITENEFQPIAEKMKRKEYQKGDLILRAGQIETRSSLVLKGIVYQYVDIEGDLFTIDITLAGMSYNAFTSFVENSPSSQIQEAITDVEIFYIEKEDSEKLLLENSAFCYIYTKLYEQVHLEREKRSLLLQHKSSYRKFELFMTTIQKAQRFLQEVPQKMIADYLAMTPETFSRVRKEYLKKIYRIHFIS